jgi:hypothetical protein
MGDRSRRVAGMVEGREAAMSAGAKAAADRYDDELLTVTEAADEATVSEHTIRRGYLGGHLKVQRMGMGGRIVRIRRRDLLEWGRNGGNTVLPPGQVR